MNLKNLGGLMVLLFGGGAALLLLYLIIYKVGERGLLVGLLFLVGLILYFLPLGNKKKTTAIIRPIKSIKNSPEDWKTILKMVQELRAFAPEMILFPIRYYRESLNSKGEKIIDPNNPSFYLTPQEKKDPEFIERSLKILNIEQKEVYSIPEVQMYLWRWMAWYKIPIPDDPKDLPMVIHNLKQFKDETAINQQRNNSYY